MKVDLKSDYHMHTVFSDGKASIGEMVVAAIDKGLDQITFTDHMPLPFDNEYAMSINAIQLYQQEINSVQKKFTGKIKINKGLEIDYLPESIPWIQRLVKMDWDHLIVSVHTIIRNNQPLSVNGTNEEFRQLLQSFNHDIKALCRQYYKVVQMAIQSGWFDIVGHLDVIKKYNVDQQYFKENEPWYRDIVMETLDVIKKQGVKMEVNMSGLNDPVKQQHPSKWIIQEAVKKNIPLVLSSDSHYSKSVGQYFNTIDQLLPN
jgi:histidinol-phosphatase (PHP family)